MEEDRKQKERLQIILETAGAVCHELNQPLMAISGYSELLLIGMSKKDPLFDKTAKILEQARKEAFRFAESSQFKESPDIQAALTERWGSRLEFAAIG